MRNAQLARLFGAGALTAALVLVPGCRDNASPEVNAPELQQPASGSDTASPGTGGSGSAGTEAPAEGSTAPTGRSSPQGSGAPAPARGSEAGSEPQQEEKGGTGRTPPGHERETR